MFLTSKDIDFFSLIIVFVSCYLVPSPVRCFQFESPVFNICAVCVILFLSKPQKKYVFYCPNKQLAFMCSSFSVYFLVCQLLFFCTLTHILYIFLSFVFVFIWLCDFLPVSAENLAKCLMQMERQLLQLEKDLETFSSHDDPTDMFFTKMAISFRHAFVHTVDLNLMDPLDMFSLKGKTKGEKYSRWTANN